MITSFYYETRFRMIRFKAFSIAMMALLGGVEACPAQSRDPFTDLSGYLVAPSGQVIPSETVYSGNSAGQNSATVTQVGSNNSAVVDVQGSRNTTLQTQTGVNNESSILLTGNQNRVRETQIGSGNSADITVSGNNNNITNTQIGSNLGIGVNQIGNGKSVSITQIGVGR
ncbi:curlin subunit CsgB [Rhodopseudomonas pseudopalustris]|uniref:Minor curlin subunit n=1 Tax=Rhodopseudomonas pseudopalustris TaxID=1513892 RepID=A0A1H8T1Z7_9BRAD|nr:curlin subunit CsgB [Rhodopseudomonas pseudopalustris]SEO84937.1 minor curlin subunit [Rhodopseudomonas pseudopalustris]